MRCPESRPRGSPGEQRFCTVGRRPLPALGQHTEARFAAPPRRFATSAGHRNGQGSVTADNGYRNEHRVGLGGAQGRATLDCAAGEMAPLLPRRHRSHVSAPGCCAWEHKVAPIRVVGMSAQCERRSARVIADHHRLGSVGLPLDPDSALDHALASWSAAIRTCRGVCGVVQMGRHLRDPGPSGVIGDWLQVRYCLGAEDGRAYQPQDREASADGRDNERWPDADDAAIG